MWEKRHDVSAFHFKQFDALSLTLALFSSKCTKTQFFLVKFKKIVSFIVCIWHVCNRRMQVVFLYTSHIPLQLRFELGLNKTLKNIMLYFIYVCYFLVISFVRVAFPRKKNLLALGFVFRTSLLLTSPG